MTQMLITFVFCLFSIVYRTEVKLWIKFESEGSILYYVSYGTFLVTCFALICIPSVRKNYPGNYICLCVFTLAFTYMVGNISSFYDTSSVLVAVGITALVCLAVSFFAVQTKIDFTVCKGLLFVLCMLLLFISFSCSLFYITLGYNKKIDCIWGGLAAFVFLVFLVYDTQMIDGGKKYELSPEEYVYGALRLYIDVVYMFIIILELFENYI